MKYLVVSDIHGSEQGILLLKNALFKEKPDCLLLLGDLLHGSYDENQNDLKALLSSWTGGTLAVCGNCDDPYSDGEYLGIELPMERELSFKGYSVHLQHRPFYANFPAKTILLNGHTHRKTLYEENGVIHCNPGSISLPRDGVPSYATMKESGLFLHDAVSGLVLDRLLF